MNRRLVSAAMLATALVVAVCAASAGATIDQVSGQFELLHSPPASVQPGALSSETVMRAFDERQKVTLTAPLSVNISQPGTYKLVADETPAVIPAGTNVSSHFVHVDKDTQFSTILTGTIHLDSDILGIVVDNAASQLFDASDYLGSPTTLYPAPLLFGRGYELNDNQQDKIVVHADRRTVDITTDIRLQLVDQLRIITVGNAPPVVSAGPPASGAEGSAIALSGSVNDPDSPSPTIQWMYAPFSGVDAGATCSFASPSSPATTITCTDDGVYTATLTANDGVNAPVSSSTTVTVSNANPQVIITSPSAGPYLPGTTIPLSASFTDAGRNDTHTCTIDWGDGTPVDTGAVSESNGAGTCTGSHAYATSAGGSNTVTVAVTDDDTGTGTASLALSVFTPRSLKQDTIDRANALIPFVNKPDADKLRGVVTEVTTSLDASRWVDDTHLDTKKGQEVFDHEKKAVNKLEDLLARTTIPDATVQAMIDNLLNADRILAQTAIDDAIARGGKPGEISTAQDEMQKAADEIAKGHFDAAVDHYKHAWEHATKA